MAKVTFGESNKFSGKAEREFVKWAKGEGWHLDGRDKKGGLIFSHPLGFSGVVVPIIANNEMVAFVGRVRLSGLVEAAKSRPKGEHHGATP